MISTFHGNPATSIIIIYSPTNSSEDEVINKFYDERRRAIETIPQHNVLIIIGDFNARIGKYDGNFTYHQETNKNGVLLIDIINEKELVITNTCFQKKLNKLWTYMDPCCRKYQLDYILMRKKWRNSIINVEAYSTFSSIGSDHRIVSSKVILSLRANRKKLPRKLRYNWPLFKSDMSLQEKYAIEIQNRFILKCDEEISVTYEQFIVIHFEVTRELVPLLIKTKKMCPSTENTVSRAREDTRIVNREYEDNPNENNQHNTTESRNKLYTAYTHIAVDTLEEKIKQIENADLNRKYLLIWELINEINGKKQLKKE